MHKRVVKVVWLSLMVGSALWAVQKGTQQKANHLELATMMYYDGDYKKAAKELLLVEVGGEEGYDGAKYFSLKGLIAMKQERYDEAIKSLKRAIDETKVKVFVDPYAVKQEKRKHIFLKDFKKEKPSKRTFDPQKIRRQKLEQLYLFLSRTYYKKGDYANAIKALEQAGEAGRNRPELFVYKADCYWKQKDHASAIGVLNEAMDKFPDNLMLPKKKFFYLTTLKLYHPAVKVAQQFLSDSNSMAKEYLSFAQVFYRAGENKKAIELLERAKVRFEDAPKISLLLGNIYLKEAMVHTPAALFEQSASIDKKYLKDAVEMYRRAGEIPRAIYLNSQNPDPIEQLRQKVAILVSTGDFEKLIGLRDDLLRYGLLEEDSIRYALAYAYYTVKEYDHAEKELKQITDSQLFSKATIIRKNIEKCKEKPLECL